MKIKFHDATGLEGFFESNHVQTVVKQIQPINAPIKESVDLTASDSPKPRQLYVLRVFLEYGVDLPIAFSNEKERDDFYQTLL